MLLLALLASASPAYAFHVDDHVQITQRAVSELQACGLLPTQWTTDFTAAVADADKWEDYDVVRKWSNYSHYYNPNHPLDQFRSDSSVSVTESVASIQASPHDDQQVNPLIGRIVHHVQDASTPAHAVPVAHAFSDGFELLDVSAYFAEPLSPAVCPEISAAEPMEVLHANALATLDSLQETVTMQIQGATVQNTWLDTFWKLGEGNEFGNYGLVGNGFGTMQVTLPDGTSATVSPDQYFAFKRERTVAAVRATEAAILWINRVRGY